MNLDRAPQRNIFLVAAVALPLLVVMFFLVASAVPRWLVAPPAYDFVFRALDSYSENSPRAEIEFRVRDGRLEATARPVEGDRFAPSRALYVYEHDTGNVRKISVDLPAVLPAGEPPLTIAVDQLADRRVIAQSKAPDGYELHMPARNSPGLIGDLFGMRGHDQGLAIAHNGRVVRINPPSSVRYYDASSIDVIGWLEPAGSR